MPNTTFSFDTVLANPNHATPHGRLADASLVPNPLSLEQKQLSAIAPAGAAWSNVQDQARYLITQLNQGVSPDGRRVVSAANLTKTWQPHVQISPEASYGLGWVIAPYKGARWLQHLGATPGGFSSDLGFLPEVNLGFVVLSNAEAAAPFLKAVHYRILELAFGQPMEHDAQLIQMDDDMRQQSQAAVASTQPRIDPAAVAPYLGRYTNPTLGEIALTLEQDELICDIGAFKFELRSLGDGNYIGWNPPGSGLPFKFEQAAGQSVVSTIDYWTHDPIRFTRIG
jgi:CubicO group peptidase (beta-lactamase class C family)